MSVSINGTGGLTFSDSSVQSTAATGFGFKNRIINGAMVIDQRNAGASVTPGSGSSQYAVDRFLGYASQNTKYTAQRNAGAVTPPSGFTNYLGVTSSSAYSVTSTDLFFLIQNIEGFNTADLMFGSASASTVTVSFWVRSSLTGTFGGVLQNSAQDRNYPFSYTVSSANTWEQKTVTIAGDTSGTWIGATNGIGMRLLFALGTGSTYTGTAGSWTSSAIYGVSGQQQVVGTSGATFYITGVQLEKGSTATSFDYRPYGTELALCQRYLPVFNSGGANPAFVGLVAAQTTTSVFVTIPFLVAPRVPPTGISVSSASHFQVVIGGAGPIPSGITFNQGAPTAGMVNAAVTGVTAGTAGIMYGISTAAQIQFTGCEL